MPTAVARAQDPTDIVVRYSGPPGCSSAAEFIERATPRLPGLALIEGQGDVGLEVILTENQSGVAAELVIHLEDGGSLSRSIQASTCDEATEAIAFVASVALDPGARDPVVVQSARPPEGDGSHRATSDGARDEALEDDDAAGGAERGRRGRRSPSAGGGGLLGVGAALAFGVAPSTMLGPELSLRWSARRPGAWSPALLLDAQYLILEGHEEAAGVAAFHQGRANVAFCPSAFRVGVLSGRPCLGMAGGWVESEGSDTETPGQATRPYFDTNLGGHLEVALGRQSAVILSGYVGVPWIRDSYRFDATVFHRTAPVTGGLALSIGARLW